MIPTKTLEELVTIVNNDLNEWHRRRAWKDRYVSVDVLQQKLQSPEFLEKLAELEHKQWSEFVQYLIGFGPIHGELTAKEFWRNYYELSKIPYAKLTEKQKESDRKFARKVVEQFLVGLEPEEAKK